MPRQYGSCLPLLLAATALVAPGAAAAQSTPREAELEARLAALEAEMQSLRADLAGTRGDQAQNAAKIDEIATKVAAPQPQATQPADGFRSGATTIKLGGFIKLVASNMISARGFMHLPSRK
jgi:uncharacterized coiled-coil protein SlyX